MRGERGAQEVGDERPSRTSAESGPVGTMITNPVFVLRWIWENVSRREFTRGTGLLRLLAGYLTAR